MRHVLAIFQKDARHLWPQIAAFWVLLAATAALDPVYTHRRPLPAETLLWTALPLACWYLVMAAIFENRLPGDRPYWLTRPYPRGALAAAKALFVAAFVNLPVLVAHATVMAALGTPPWQQAAALLWQQVFLTAFAIVPAAAIASVTTGLRQVLLAALTIVVPLFVATVAWSFLLRRGVFFLSPAWASGFWLKTLFTAAVLSLGGAAVLSLQYWRRATGWSRALAAAVAFTALMAGGLVHKDQTFVVQAWLSPAAPQAGSVELDADSARSPVLRYPRERLDYGLRHVEIPVRLAATAPDAIPLPAVAARAAVAGRALYAEVREQPAGKWWLSIDAPTAYFDSVKNAAVDLEGSIDLTLFRRGVALPTPRFGPVVAPGIGVCRSRRNFDGRFEIECYSPAPQAALALEFPGGGRHWIVSRSTADAPLPAVDQFETVQEFSSPTSFASLDDLAPLRLITEQPMGHLRARYQLRGIRLADFVYPRTYRGR